VFSDSKNNLVQGNRIGTDVTGTLAVGNADGVVVFDAVDSTIGGTAPLAGNLISGNLGSGIQLTSSARGTLVQRNVIRAHGGNGILIQNASNNIIGGTAAGAANTIALNGNDGVLVDRGTGNAIRRNAIFANTRLGIELINGGNREQASPVLSSATSEGGNTTI